jgi:hypothetical protein
MKRALLVGLLGGGLAIAGALAAALPASAGGRPFSVELSGSNEVSEGDPDGAGTAYLTLNQGKGEVCFELSYFDIETPTRAHIHAAPVGANGPIVVAFFDFVAPPPTEGCVEADKELIKQIRQNPEGYYVNVHNAEFPGGAIRGQLAQ